MKTTIVELEKKSINWTEIEEGELKQLAECRLGISDYDYVAEEVTPLNCSIVYPLIDNVEYFNWKLWALFLEGNRRYNVRVLLSRMVMMGIIPPGTVVIKVNRI